MINGEKYKNEIISEFKVGMSIGCATKKLREADCGDEFDCPACCVRAFNWLLKEYEEPILTEEGKEFLKQLIAPFISNEFVCICINKELQTLRIDYETGWVSYSKKVLGEKWDLFKNLDYEFHYTSKELAL